MQKNTTQSKDVEYWDNVYQHFIKKQSVWTDLNSKYDGASPYIVEKIMKLPKSVHILDVGCGDGRNLIYLAKQGYVVSGIDISPEAIRRVRPVLAKQKIKAKLRVGDVRALPYENESFDAIIYEQVNVHTKDPESALKEFQRVLKPSGLLLFETTSEHDPLSRGRKEFYDHGFYLRFYSRPEVKILVGKYFNVKNVEYNTISHYNHGEGYATRKKHFHKSYLAVAYKIYEH
jgi:ubiquinone/menaquinone biosynthesis C-methylase UbiE